MSKADEVVRVIHHEVHGYVGPPREPEDRAEFAALLERMRREACRRLAHLAAADPASPQVGAERVGIYLYGCGLAALGRPDALGDVFEHWDATSPGSRAWRLAAVVTEGLPLPRRADGIPDSVAARQWVRSHVGELTWDRDAGRFGVPSR